VKTNSPGYTRVYRAVSDTIGGSLGTIAADPESAGGRSRSSVFRALVVSSSSPDDWEKPYTEEHAMKKCDISEKGRWQEQKALYYGHDGEILHYTHKKTLLLTLRPRASSARLLASIVMALHTLQLRRRTQRMSTVTTVDLF
jgi:hypothetical protein